MKIVCFDFDGTLADSFPFLIYSFGKIFGKYLGVEMNEALFAKLSGPDERGFLMKEFKDQYKEEYWEEYLDIYRSDANKMISLFPGMKEMLFSLKKKGYHLVFLTGRSKETAEISLKDMGIYDLFEAHYSGSIVGCVKAELLNQISNDFKTEPKDILYVGDSVQDIKDSRTAGTNIISVLFSNPTWWEEIKKINPDYAYNAKELEAKIINFMNKE